MIVEAVGVLVIIVFGIGGVFVSLYMGSWAFAALFAVITGLVLYSIKSQIE
jgi:4-hydroxybenzoate polyprenyltransferase